MWYAATIFMGFCIAVGATGIFAMIMELTAPRFIRERTYAKLFILFWIIFVAVSLAVGR